MKKIFLLSALLIATTVFTTVEAKDKKKQKKPLQQVIVEKAALRTQADSISYAAGMAMTRGLEMYLTQNVGITPAQMPEFMRGLHSLFYRPRHCQTSRKEYAPRRYLAI